MKSVQVVAVVAFQAQVHQVVVAEFLAVADVLAHQFGIFAFVHTTVDFFER